MSKRHVIGYKPLGEDNNQKTIEVVYYSQEVSCPICAATGYDPSSISDPCRKCHGTKLVEKIDFGAMTPKQVAIFKQYKEDLESSKELLDNL